MNSETIRIEALKAAARIHTPTPVGLSPTAYAPGYTGGGQYGQTTIGFCSPTPEQVLATARRFEEWIKNGGPA